MAERSRAIASSVSHWFDYNKRDLSFRQTRDPYAIMVSEFMLQQTTVTAVLPYYDRFIKAFPTLDKLAETNEDEVLAHWAGLGYYRRARQLLSAAQVLVRDYRGEFPETVADIIKLPGVGRYTAGAILSSAFDLPAPILEANTIRFFARLNGVEGMIGDSVFMNSLWQIADSLVKHAVSPRTFNMGAMELGAVICRAKPQCDVCPVQNHCVAYSTDTIAKIPQLRPRPATLEINTVCLVIKNRAGDFLMRRIPAGEWHQGMWEFPSRRIDNSLPPSTAAKEIAFSWFGLKPLKLKKLVTIKYPVTHHMVSCHVFHCVEAISFGLPDNYTDEFAIVSFADIAHMPMGSAQKKLYKLLEKRNAG